MATSQPVAPAGVPGLTFLLPREGLFILTLYFLSPSQSPICHHTFSPFPWRFSSCNGFGREALQRIFESVSRSGRLFPHLSVHLLDPSESSSRLGRHNVSFPLEVELLKYPLILPLEVLSTLPSVETKRVGDFPELTLGLWLCRMRSQGKACALSLPFLHSNHVYGQRVGCVPRGEGGGKMKTEFTASWPSIAQQ